MGRNYGTSTKLEHATQEHCYYAFSVLDAYLRGAPIPDPDFENVETALFVTWNIKSSSSDRGYRLRGCIGTLEPRELRVGLKDYALTSALRDSRFSPISAREFDKLSCKVSLLSCFEQASSWQDWTVGKHGIIIEFMDPDLHCRRSATFLPDVPPEQGWDVRDTLEALIHKAGYSGPATEALLDSIKLTRYQSTVASATYQQYKACKEEMLAEQQRELVAEVYA